MALTKAITNIETVSRDFGDHPEQQEHRSFCTFTENGYRKVAMLTWRDRQLERPSAPEYTDPGFSIMIGFEDPEAPNRVDTWLDDVSFDDIAREPFYGLAPSASVPVLEDALLRFVAQRLNPGAGELIDAVIEHENLKDQSRAGTTDSRALLKRIRTGVRDRGCEFDTATLSSLGARSAIGYAGKGLTEDAAA